MSSEKLPSDWIDSFIAFINRKYLFYVWLNWLNLLKLLKSYVFLTMDNKIFF